MSAANKHWSEHSKAAQVPGTLLCQPCRRQVRLACSYIKQHAGVDTRACGAGSLSHDLLIAVFQLLLDSAGRGRWNEALRGETPRLRQAVQLCAVCSSWRRAAVQAMHECGALAWLEPDPQLAPVAMSPLLGQLVSGCRHLVLATSLLVAPRLPRLLEHARPAILSVRGPHDAGEAAGAALALCSAVQELRCTGGVLPLGYPPDVQALTLALPFPLYAQWSPDPWVLDQRARQEAQATDALLGSLRRLAGLRDLALTGCVLHSTLLNQRGSFAGFPTLRCLTVQVDQFDACQPGFDLAPLGAATSAGIRVQLHLSLQEAASLSSRPGVWMALCTTLAALPPLFRVKLFNLQPGSRLPHAADQLLASVRCKELALTFRLCDSMPEPADLLPALSCGLLCCRFQEVRRSSFSLHWSTLSSRPGIYLLEPRPYSTLYVTHCPGSLPCWPGRCWALVLVQPELGSVQGLPLNLFERGPRGLLVWRTPGLAHCLLEKAYAMLL